MIQQANRHGVKRHYFLFSLPFQNKGSLLPLFTSITVSPSIFRHPPNPYSGAPARDVRGLGCSSLAYVESTVGVRILGALARTPKYPASCFRWD